MKLPLRLRFILLVIIALLYCTSDKIAGNASESGNPTISGAIYNAHGQSAAVNALVVIRAKRTIAGYIDNGTQNVTQPESTYTDTHGFFGFDSNVTPGMYVIEASQGDYSVLIDSIVVISKENTVNLPPDTLEATGAIHGIVKLSESDDPRKTVVSAYGFDRSAMVGADGSFSFEHLPAGNYHLLIWSAYDNYGVIDTVNIIVEPSTVTDMGIINMPYNGIATVTRPLAQYDTLLQQVELRWQRPQTGTAAFFNVYRRTLDPASAVFTQLNAFALADTQFTDTICEQDKTYEYRITALDKDMNEGKRSAGLSVKIALYNIKPFNVSADYDTSRQAITLHWTSPDADGITGFNIYRINMDLGESFGPSLNNHPVTETSFTDSLFALYPRAGVLTSASAEHQGPAFAYCISAIIRQTRVGEKSDTVKVQIDLTKITPSEMTAAFDSVNKSAGLKWNIADTALIKGFAVYRRCTSANEQQLTLLSTVSAVHTYYADSTGIASQTYEYSVGSLLRDSRSVIRSVNAAVRFASQ